MHLHISVLNLVESPVQVTKNFSLWLNSESREHPRMLAGGWLAASSLRRCRPSAS